MKLENLHRKLKTKASWHQFGFAFSSTTMATEKPNILFIFFDDFGWRDTSYMGSDFYETPHIDALATQGMIFNDAY